MIRASRNGMCRIGVALFLVFLLQGMLIESPASASGSCSIAVRDGVFGGTTVAAVTPTSLGGTVFVQASCYQGGNLVYGQTLMTGSNGLATLTLGPTPRWLGGSAACTADAGYFRNGRWRTMASTTFVVLG